MQKYLQCKKGVAKQSRIISESECMNRHRQQDLTSEYSQGLALSTLILYWTHSN